MLEYLGISEPTEFVPHLVALALAYLLAFPIGWNRERAERSAGLRTFPLVAIASCGCIQAAESLTAGNAEAMARIVEGMVRNGWKADIGERTDHVGNKGAGHENRDIGRLPHRRVDAGDLAQC